MNCREKGNEKEQVAVEYLQERGLEILERNYRVRGGEIDIIAKHEKTIVFIEVKYRNNAKCGKPTEAVDLSKQRTISRVADHYRMKHSLREDMSYRFDVISILGEEISWLENAFDYIG